MDKRLFTLVLISISRIHAHCSKEVIAEYEKLVIQAQADALTYQLPTNAEEYEAKNNNTADFGTYDFVINGGGSAGSVVANRLSEISNWRILLLEAGDYGNKESDIPYLYFPVQFTKYNWGYNSVPQNNACQGFVDKMCPFPRGRGIGGSSLINTLVYARGYKNDFDKWASSVNDNMWSYENVLPYFKKSENYVHNDELAPFEPEFHGENGYLTVNYYIPPSLHLKKFLEANKELGFEIADYNANKLGASTTQINTIKGRRLDNGKAFIHPIKYRKNLTVLTNSFVTKIIIDDQTKKAVGVNFNHNGRKYFVKASKEVILSAGVFGSAQILMLSGVGPKEHLKDVSIKLVHDLEVGTTLLDHPTFYGLSFDTNHSEPVKSLKEDVKKFLCQGTGPLSAPNNQQGLGFYESSCTKGTGVPNIELLLIPPNATNDLSQKGMRLSDSTYEDIWANANRTQSMNMLVINLHSKSVGKFRLKSNNPFEYPMIDPNFLSDSEGKDISILYEGVQLALKISQTRAFQSINARLQSGPLKACKQYTYLSKDYWYCALRQVTSNLYHPSSTCKMGYDVKQGAVVDSKLKVHGIGRLRIADASVFPMTLAGHPNAVVTMVGEILGDLLKSAWL